MFWGYDCLPIISSGIETYSILNFVAVKYTFWDVTEYSK